MYCVENDIKSLHDPFSVNVYWFWFQTNINRRKAQADLGTEIYLQLNVILQM